MVCRASQTTIEDICGCNGHSGENGYCLLRDLIKLSGMDDRMLEQYNCIKKFKYIRGINGEDGGWNSAMDLWVKEGYAKRFSEIYKPGMKTAEIYKNLEL